VDLFAISIFIVSQWFYAEVFRPEEVSVDTFSAETDIRIDNANKSDSLSLLGYTPNLLELATQEPHVMDGD
jgi:hypothetical protein